MNTDRQAWKPIKCEVNFPGNSWDRSWELAFSSGLNSDQSSFLFKLLHDILPTGSRLHRLKQKESSACTLCRSGADDDRLHALLACSFNSEINDWVVSLTHKVVANSKTEDIISLNLFISEPMHFPLIWTLSHVLMLVWQSRLNKKSISLYHVRAEIEAKINILRKSRLKGSQSDCKYTI